MTVEDYLTLEAAAEGRHEYEAGLLWPVSGVTKRHARVAVNLTVRLFDAAEARGWRLHAGGVRLRLSSTRYYYPDLMVACGPDVDPSSEAAPCFVAEVLSPESERRDRGAKLAAYLGLPSLGQYALVDPDRRRVEVYERSGDGWRYGALAGGDELEVRCLGERVALAEVYAGLEPPAGELGPG